jgi:hypothetical protein
VPQTDAHNPALVQLDGAKLAYDSNGQIWVLDLSNRSLPTKSRGERGGNHQHTHVVADGDTGRHSLPGPVVASHSLGDSVGTGSNAHAADQRTGYRKSTPLGHRYAQRIAFVIWSHNEDRNVWVALSICRLIPVADQSCKLEFGKARLYR